ncbi:hypothetical protein MPER_10251 [Moniliophthora perniciosa FA553]|nr:hypothetical protein MPER_10251 [Moniliophthora perniciosa FA553]
MPKTSKPTRSHISGPSIALKLAQPMNNYFTIHSDSFGIVQQDPHPNFFADGKAQIAIYDDILKKEPVSYEDYFYRAQYALSAAFLFNHFVVAEKLEDKTFENQFWGEVDRRCARPLDAIVMV